MSTFDKRVESFEGKFAHDEEILFKVLARAKKMLGLWAAQKLGKTGAAADDYATALVVKDVAADLKSGLQAADSLGFRRRWHRPIRAPDRSPFRGVSCAGDPGCDEK